MLVARKTKRHMNLLMLVLGVLVILSTEARADMYKPWWEWGVVQNDSGNAGAITAQLSLDVTEYGVDQVLFTFSNAGPLDSSITGIYFDDGALLEIAFVDNSDLGVNFINPATSPKELTGANNVDPPFETSTGFSAQSTAPPYHDGVNPGESVGIVFNLAEGYDFDDIIAAIALGFGYPEDPDDEDDPWFTNSLRIGVNVQGIGPNDESDSYILIPIPASVILGILGLGLAGWKLRKYA